MDRMERLKMFPWTADAIRLLNRAGYCVVVMTNQSAIGRGIIDEPFLRGVHDEIDRRLARAGARIDRYYFCPHHPDKALGAYRQVCECRKPRPGHDPSGRARAGPRPDALGDDRRPPAGRGIAAMRPGVRAMLLRTGVGAGEPSAP